MANPFEVLGLEARFEIDAGELENRYLEMSRAHHPDFNPEACPIEQIAVLERSARINDAHRTLRDPWKRAAALIDLGDPAAMESTKTLCPMFLMEAMETREATLEAPPEQLDALETEVQQKIDRYLSEIVTHLQDPREAATLLHQSNYYRKALVDLKTRQQNS